LSPPPVATPPSSPRLPAGSSPAPKPPAQPSSFTGGHNRAVSDKIAALQGKIKLPQ
jgi:hypothetical protein